MITIYINNQKLPAIYLRGVLSSCGSSIRFSRATGLLLLHQYIPAAFSQAYPSRIPPFDYYSIINIFGSEEKPNEAPDSPIREKNTNEKGQEDEIEIYEDDDKEEGNGSSEGEYTSTDHSDGSYEEYHDNSSEESLSEREHS